MIRENKLGSILVAIYTIQIMEIVTKINLRLT